MKKNLYTALALTLVSAMGSMYANAGSLAFVPATETFTKDCPTTVDVVLDTEGDEVNSIDLGIILNDTFEVNSVNTEDGVFRTYSTPKTKIAKKGDFKGDKVLSLLASTSSPNGYNGKGKLLSLTITPKSDKVDLSFYMVPGHDGEDSNLMIVNSDGNIVDVLNKVENKKVDATTGECTLEKLSAIELEEPEVTILAEDVEEVASKTTKINEDKIFDENQKKLRIQDNWMYISVIIIAAILLVVLIKSKKKK